MRFKKVLTIFSTSNGKQQKIKCFEVRMLKRQCKFCPALYDRFSFT